METHQQYENLFGRRAQQDFRDVDFESEINGAYAYMLDSPARPLGFEQPPPPAILPPRAGHIDNPIVID